MGKAQKPGFRRDNSVAILPNSLPSCATCPSMNLYVVFSESIADSDDSGVGEGRARMIPGSMNRWRRILDAFYESRPILITFALATSTSMNLAQEPVRRLFSTLASCLELLDFLLNTSHNLQSSSGHLI